MQLVPASRLKPWDLRASPRAPSATIQDYLRRLRVFDLETTEPAKMLLIDALMAEIVPNHPHLKIWKAVPLETDELTGTADYLVAPDYAYVRTPLLCVAEAKRDDFVQGRAQCIAEMVACRWHNRRADLETDVFGIVSNGQAWQFYQLSLGGEVLETPLYVTSDLPTLLGALDYVVAECARRLPAEALEPG